MSTRTKGLLAGVAFGLSAAWSNWPFGAEVSVYSFISAATGIVIAGGIGMIGGYYAGR